jgi:hypothetical protein
MKLSPMTERAPNPTTRAHIGERPCPSSDHLGSITCRGWSPEGARSRGRRTRAPPGPPLPAAILRQPQAITRWVNREMTTMTLKVQYRTKLEDGTQMPAGWYVITPFCPEVVFATEQEALAYGRTEELRQG